MLPVMVHFHGENVNKKAITSPLAPAAAGVVAVTGNHFENARGGVPSPFVLETNREGSSSPCRDKNGRGGKPLPSLCRKRREGS